MKNKEIFVDHGKSNQIAVGWGMWEVRKWRKSGGNILKPRGWGEEGRQRAIAVRHYDCQTGFFFFKLHWTSCCSQNLPLSLTTLWPCKCFSLFLLCLPSCFANWRAFIYSKPSSNFILPDVFLGYSKQSQSFWSPCSTTWGKEVANNGTVYTYGWVALLCIGISYTPIQNKKLKKKKNGIRMQSQKSNKPTLLLFPSR